MRSLRSLTLRGRAFMIGGLTALCAGIALGQTPLVYVGLVGLVLPAAMAWLVTRSGYRFSLHREASPPLIAVGETSEIALKLSWHRRSAVASTLLEEELPYALGPRPRFAAGGSMSAYGYAITGETRGKYRLGPLKVSTNDPLGLVSSGRRFSGTNDLWVAPQTIALRGAPGRAVGQIRGTEQLQGFGLGSPEDLTVRQYRQGDDLRRIHWPSSAKTGDLMVRNEEHPSQAGATVLFDNRAKRHPFGFEVAVAVGASVVRHLIELGYDVRLVTADTEVHLDSVSLAQRLFAEVSVSGGELSWPEEYGADGCLIGVFGILGDRDQDALKRGKATTRTALALHLGEAAHGRAVLERSGWQVGSVRGLQTLPSVWREFSR